MNTFSKSINANLLIPEEQLFSSNLNKVDIELTDFTNQFFIQTLFRKDFRLRVGVQHKRLKIFSDTFNENSFSQEGTTFEKSDYLGVFGALKFDTYDKRFFPRKGFLFDGDFQWYLSSTDYNNYFQPFSFAKADIGYALSITEKIAFKIGSQGGFRIGNDDTNPYFNFALGGYGNNFINNFIPFFGYDFIALPGNSFVKGDMNIDYEIFNKHHLNITANFANVGEDIFTENEWFEAPEYSGYALGYGYESFLGPIEIKYTWSPETNSSIWFFNLGYWF